MLQNIHKLLVFYKIGHFLTETRSILKVLYYQKVTVLTNFTTFLTNLTKSAELTEMTIMTKYAVNSILT